MELIINLKSKRTEEKGGLGKGRGGKERERKGGKEENEGREKERREQQPSLIREKYAEFFTHRGDFTILFSNLPVHIYV